MKKNERKSTPAKGGCWFCYMTDDEETDWLFSWEWDTNLHLSCLKKAIEDNPKYTHWNTSNYDPELESFVSEFKEILK